MKILILGNNSYICSKFIKYSQAYEFECDTVSVRDNSWETVSFSTYDSILCPIGIAHVSSDIKMESKYYEINRDLPVKIAKKAKQCGAKQFIFFSSMIVYGKDLPLGKELLLNKNSLLNPENFYGKSKKDAELLLSALEDEAFKVARVRIPMVYGPDCRGNFPKLLKIASNFSVFPDICNQRSMIYIDNLCEFLCKLIKSREGGIFHPQNTEYVSTKEIIQTASACFNNKIVFTKMFNPLIKFASKKIDIVNKIFGTKIYDRSLSPDIDSYNVVNFEDSIKYCVEAYKKLK